MVERNPAVECSITIVSTLLTTGLQTDEPQTQKNVMCPCILMYISQLNDNYLGIKLNHLCFLSHSGE